MGSFDIENDFLFLIILLYWAIINLQEKALQKRQDWCRTLLFRYIYIYIVFYFCFSVLLLHLLFKVKRILFSCISGIVNPSIKQKVTLKERVIQENKRGKTK